MGSINRTSPKPVIQMKITAMDNGRIDVNGIPPGITTALQILAGANAAIVDFFINKAKAGGLDENNTLKQSMIATPPESQNKIITI